MANSGHINCFFLVYKIQQVVNHPALPRTIFCSHLHLIFIQSMQYLSQNDNKCSLVNSQLSWPPYTYIWIEYWPRCGNVKIVSTDTEACSKCCFSFCACCCCICMSLTVLRVREKLQVNVMHKVATWESFYRLFHSNALPPSQLIFFPRQLT